MGVNILAVLAATAAMFAVGAFWYMVPFAKLWGRIHGFDKLSKKEQETMAAKMGPWYAVQLVVTLASAYTLAVLMNLMPNQSPYVIAGLVWFGFVVPTEASAMIFGGSKPEYIWHKIMISVSESLIHLLVAAWVLSLF